MSLTTYKPHLTLTAWGWPNGTFAERKRIRDAHIAYIRGLLWFLATDPASGESLHAEMATLGLCDDEYGGEPFDKDDPPHWPYQLYVREARRLVGDFVWTAHDLSPALQSRSIGVGGYTFESVYALTRFLSNPNSQYHNLAAIG